MQQSQKIQDLNKRGAILMENLIELAISLNKKSILNELMSSCDIQNILHVNKSKLDSLLLHYGDKIVSDAFKAVRKDRYWEKDKSKSYSVMIQHVYNKYPIVAARFFDLWFNDLIDDLTLNVNQLDNVKDRDEYIFYAQRVLVSFVMVGQYFDSESKFEKILDLLNDNKKILDSVFIYEILHHKKLDNQFNKITTYNLLKKEALDKIESMLEKFPKDSDWDIDELPKCVCNLCMCLKEFLSCRNSQEKVWPISQEKRHHVRQEIDSLRLPVSYQTIRKGSPYKLILKKTAQLSSWRKARHHQQLPVS